MARAINIQLIIEEIQSSLEIPSYSEHDKGFDDGLKYVLGLIEEAPTLAPPNEPLTLDELREMNGEPVYVVFRPDNSGDKPQFWALVSADKQHDEVYLLDSMGGAGSYDEIWANLEAIYRRPPEGEEDT